jgi:N-acetyl-gamma-glutamyl-phosphate reductase
MSKASAIKADVGEANRIEVGIVGGTGYTGAELLRLLAHHPRFRPTVVTSRGEAGQAVAALFPGLRGVVDLHFTAPDPARLADCQLVFCAAPNGTAMGLAPALLKAGVKVIDLAADFRFPSAAEWERWYGIPHTCPELLPEAVYGLPEIAREEIRKARLVANPGCYPTATILGFLPLVRAGLVEPDGLIADVKSGVSGAGRGAEVRNLFCEASENLKAYGMAGHRHLPEIRGVLGTLAGAEVGLTFIPHLIPMSRGIHATLYAELVDPEVDLQGLYTRCYAEEPFVDVLPPGSCPETRSVRGANLCRIAVHRPQGGRRAVILSVIDNLVKGAAGQAVQNANLLFGLPEGLGLDPLPLVP